MNQDNEKVVFKKSFRGYSINEVEEYLDSLRNDIEALKAEEAELYRRLDAANAEIDKYKRAESVRGDIIVTANSKADEIIKDAKNRAAHVIIRTSKQCNNIVADMVAQVEEQKNIYEAAKREVLKFRSDLFGKYEEHIKKINAFVEATGASGSDALTSEELDSYFKMLTGTEKDDDSSEVSFPDNEEISEEVEKEIEQIKKEAAYAANQAVEAKKNAVFGEDSLYSDFVSEEASDNGADTAAEKETEATAAEESASVGEKNAESEEAERPFDPAPAAKSDAAVGGTDDCRAEEASNSDTDGLTDNAEDKTISEASGEQTEAPEHAEAQSEAADKENILSDESDLDEYGEEGPDYGLVFEFDGPVSVNDVFGSVAIDDNFDMLYGEETSDEAGIKEEASNNAPAEGYGFDFQNRPDPDDDSEEFYSEKDTEFKVTSSDAVPTEEVSSIGHDMNTEKPSRRKWKIKRSMSLTDEFKAIGTDNDNKR